MQFFFDLDDESMIDNLEERTKIPAFEKTESDCFNELKAGCEKGDVMEVKRTLEVLRNLNPQFNVSIPFGNDRKPILHSCCRYDCPDVLDILLNTPQVDCNAQSAVYNTPLFYAVKHNAVCNVKKLLEKGADPLLISTKAEMWPMNCAARRGFQSVFVVMLEFLIQQKDTRFSINAVDKYKDTYLHLAVEAGNVEFARYLYYELCADPELKNSAQESSRKLYWKNPKMAKVLEGIPKKRIDETDVSVVCGRGVVHA